MRKHAVVLSCEGTELTKWERGFFSEFTPFGMILFSRNIQTPKQLKNLTDQLKEIICSDLMIFIDQEGGRVQRLKPPYWTRFPPMKVFEKQYLKNKLAAKRAVYLNACLIGYELVQSGITIDCAPVLDLYFENANWVIGDRAFSSNPETGSVLAQSFCNGLIDCGVLPVIKHMPGHGRAKLDSHEALPFIQTPLEELKKTDFIPFQKLNHMLIGMTAHIVYEVFDSDFPVTFSKQAIQMGIRELIGFQGLLISDDIAMKALSGSFSERTERAIHAGCDLALYCQGKKEEIEEIANVAPVLSGISLKRAEAVSSFFKSPKRVMHQNMDKIEMYKLEFNQLLSENQISLDI